MKYYGHDSALFIVEPETKKVFAMPTERITRYKHDFLSPHAVLERYISYSGCDPKNIKNIVVGYSFKEAEKMTLPSDFYTFHKNFRKFANKQFKKDVDMALKEFAASSFPKKLVRLLGSTSGIRLIFDLGWNKIRGGQKLLSIEDSIRIMLKHYFPEATISVTFYDHETSHAISAHYTSPFSKELVIAVDGFGDGDFSKVFIADKGSMKQIAESTLVKRPSGSLEYKEPLIGSIGIIYSYITELLGFVPNADEGKVEALAAYGKPIPSFLDELVSIFSITKSHGLLADGDRLETILNYNRVREIIQKNSQENVSATIQKFLETVTLTYLKHLQNIAPFNAIALSGGVAANVINNLIIFEHVTKNIHIVPAMADDGSAQGAAISALIDAGYSYEDLSWLRSQTMPYHGTSYTKGEIKSALQTHTTEVSYEDLGDEWPESVAKLVCQEKVGAIFHGKMEWGPRALGNRSLIAIANKADFRERINKEIKRRPYFQPFCPSILAEERDRLFEESYLNKHMTCAFRLKKEFVSVLPSSIHIDGTARVQFVEEKDNPLYYRLLKKVKELSGFGVIINTSFNKHGRTIVESPTDAIRDFIDTDMDFLVIEGFLVRRN